MCINGQRGGKQRHTKNVEVSKSYVRCRGEMKWRDTLDCNLVTLYLLVSVVKLSNSTVCPCQDWTENGWILWRNFKCKLSLPLESVEEKHGNPCMPFISNLHSMVWCRTLRVKICCLTGGCEEYQESSLLEWPPCFPGGEYTVGMVGEGGLFVYWLVNVPATGEYLKDGSAQTILHAATLR